MIHSMMKKMFLRSEDTFIIISLDNANYFGNVMSGNLYVSKMTDTSIYCRIGFQSDRVISSHSGLLFFIFFRLLCWQCSDLMSLGKYQIDAAII
jgi:hypothetical protein